MEQETKRHGNPGFWLFNRFMSLGWTSPKMNNMVKITEVKTNQQVLCLFLLSLLWRTISSATVSLLHIQQIGECSRGNDKTSLSCLTGKRWRITTKPRFGGLRKSSQKIDFLFGISKTAGSPYASSSANPFRIHRSRYQIAFQIHSYSSSTIIKLEMSRTSRSTSMKAMLAKNPSRTWSGTLRNSW